MGSLDRAEGIASSARLSRRGFMAAGGVLAVSLALPIAKARGATGNSLDAAQSTSWFEINADNTILYRTGKCDFGQSTIYTAYPQIVAEELCVPFEAIVGVVSGDTDRTPDGGGTFGMLRTNAMNLRKAAAYTREALLDLAATRLGVPRAEVSVANGVVTGGGKKITYGELVKGQNLSLSIPIRGAATDFQGLVVDGNPPLKPVSEYTIVGKPFRNSSLGPKMAGKTVWVTDVTVPGMLHGRVVLPPTLGSTLIEAGKLDKQATPNAQLVVMGSFVGVVAPTEWEAIQASQQVAGGSRWTEWKGLPGSDGLVEHLRKKADWSAVPVTKGAANAGDEKSVTAAKVHSATYHLPYHKHAPIGPSVAMAEFATDGTVTVHTSTQNPQFLRAGLALMLGVSGEKVVVRTYPGSGHYGRSNGGNSGAEDHAVLLAKAVGKPVRVQWMRADDMQWSTQSPTSLSDVRIALDANGKIASYKVDHFAPPMQDDRLIGAKLAAMPVIAPPGLANKDAVHRAENRVADAWLYSNVEVINEQGHATWQIGEKESPTGIGLRDHSMRTPVQYQQNFPREAAINEAAALAGADALQFRIDHIKEQRVKDLLVRLRDESGWDTRPSPSPKASATGDGWVRGRGASLMLRANGYWACAAHVAVNPSTGELKVERVTLAVDLGIVVNPLQLKRQAEAGCLMGISQALHEEVMFDQGAVTSVDWASYPILNMSEAPPIKVVLIDRPETGVYGQGSESANALAAPAIAGAVLDATGKAPRRIPLNPDAIKTLLAS